MEIIKNIEEILISDKIDSEKIKELIVLINETKQSELEGDFEKIKKLLYSEEWPEAVLHFQIADENSEEDKTDRAEGILDILIEEPLENKKFLDFGCGEGHVAQYASTKNSVSVGYDVVQQGNLSWEKDEKFLLTTNFEKVKEKGPFDIIIIYDVLDHAENPLDVLLKASSVLNQNGSIYLRCHPWCGRHGGHAYQKLNRAFVHLVLKEDELKKLGLDLPYNNKYLYPLLSYKKLIEETDLKIVFEEIEDERVEHFFKNNDIIKNRILDVFETRTWGNPPEFQMSQCFIDYILKRRRL